MTILKNLEKNQLLGTTGWQTLFKRVKTSRPERLKISDQKTSKLHLSTGNVVEIWIWQSCGLPISMPTSTASPFCTLSAHRPWIIEKQHAAQQSGRTTWYRPPKPACITDQFLYHAWPPLPDIVGFCFFALKEPEHMGYLIALCTLEDCWTWYVNMRSLQTQAPSNIWWQFV